MMAVLLAAGLSACNTADNNDGDTTKVSKNTTYETKVEKGSGDNYTANTTREGATATVTHVDSDHNDMDHAMDKAAHKAGHMADKAGNAMGNMADKAGHMADKAGNKVANAVDNMTTEGTTVVALTETDPRFSKLNELIVAAGLAETLNSGEYTVFAPTNAAFSAVPKATMDKLAKNQDKLKEVLMYHVVSNKVPAKKVVTMTEAQPLRSGAGIVIAPQQDGVVMLNNKTRVVETDIMADNGVVHVIDSVLIPSDLTL